MLVSHYDHILVVTSFVVAILASSTALNMAGRVTTSSGSAARIWLVGGSVAMGIGIWAMHFIGMLAMSLPVTLSYDPLITAASLLIAIGSALFALWLVCGAELKVSRLIPGSLVLGCGIAAMHYTGMAALLVEPGIVWPGDGWHCR
ncbi:MHYT domain (predicted integral membrane sensor domain) [Cronobacter sakazakii]|nr:MHYT domain (predicted integral membrane sensor domain) [Cronobacter sakazakii]